MNLSGRGRGLRSVLVVVLCALFFLLAMGITLLGSGIYRDTVAAADETFTYRTALSYLVNQVRRGDVADGVSVGEFGGGDALFLRELGYVTILYCHDGALRELYMEDGLGLAPEDGVVVMPLPGLELSADGGILTISVTGESGRSYRTTLAPRSAGATGEVAS